MNACPAEPDGQTQCINERSRTVAGCAGEAAGPKRKYESAASLPRVKRVRLKDGARAVTCDRLYTDTTTTDLRSLGTGCRPLPGCHVGDVASYRPSLSFSSDDGAVWWTERDRTSSGDLGAPHQATTSSPSEDAGAIGEDVSREAEPCAKRATTPSVFLDKLRAKHTKCECQLKSAGTDSVRDHSGTAGTGREARQPSLASNEYIRFVTLIFESSRWACPVAPFPAKDVRNSLWSIVVSGGNWQLGVSDGGWPVIISYCESAASPSQTSVNYMGTGCEGMSVFEQNPSDGSGPRETTVVVDTSTTGHCDSVRGGAHLNAVSSERTVSGAHSQSADILRSGHLAIKRGDGVYHVVGGFAACRDGTQRTRLVPVVGDWMTLTLERPTSVALRCAGKQQSVDGSYKRKSALCDVQMYRGEERDSCEAYLVPDSGSVSLPSATRDGRIKLCGVALGARPVAPLGNTTFHSLPRSRRSATHSSFPESKKRSSCPPSCRVPAPPHLPLLPLPTIVKSATMSFIEGKLGISHRAQRPRVCDAFHKEDSAEVDSCEECARVNDTCAHTSLLHSMAPDALGHRYEYSVGVDNATVAPDDCKEDHFPSERNAVESDKPCEVDAETVPVSGTGKSLTEGFVKRNCCEVTNNVCLDVGASESFRTYGGEVSLPSSERAVRHGLVNGSQFETGHSHSRQCTSEAVDDDECSSPEVNLTHVSGVEFSKGGTVDIPKTHVGEDGEQRHLSSDAGLSPQEQKVNDLRGDLSFDHEERNGFSVEPSALTTYAPPKSVQVPSTLVVELCFDTDNFVSDPCECALSKGGRSDREAQVRGGSTRRMPRERAGLQGVLPRRHSQGAIRFPLDIVCQGRLSEMKKTVPEWESTSQSVSPTTRKPTLPALVPPENRGYPTMRCKSAGRVECRNTWISSRIPTYGIPVEDEILLTDLQDPENASYSSDCGMPGASQIPSDSPGSRVFDRHSEMVSRRETTLSYADSVKDSVMSSLGCQPNQDPVACSHGQKGTPCQNCPSCEAEVRKHFPVLYFSFLNFVDSILLYVCSFDKSDLCVSRAYTGPAVSDTLSVQAHGANVQASALQHSSFTGMSEAPVGVDVLIQVKPESSGGGTLASHTYDSGTGRSCLSAAELCIQDTVSGPHRNNSHSSGPFIERVEGGDAHRQTDDRPRTDAADTDVKLCMSSISAGVDSWRPAVTWTLEAGDEKLHSHQCEGTVGGTVECPYIDDRSSRETVFKSIPNKYHDPTGNAPRDCKDHTFDSDSPGDGAHRSADSSLLHITQGVRGSGTEAVTLHVLPDTNTRNEGHLGSTGYEERHHEVSVKATDGEILPRHCPDTLLLQFDHHHLLTEAPGTAGSEESIRTTDGCPGLYETEQFSSVGARQDANWVLPFHGSTHLPSGNGSDKSVEDSVSHFDFSAVVNRYSESNSDSTALGTTCRMCNTAVDTRATEEQFGAPGVADLETTGREETPSGSSLNYTTHVPCDHHECAHCGDGGNCATDSSCRILPDECVGHVEDVVTARISFMYVPRQEGSADDAHVHSEATPVQCSPTDSPLYAHVCEGDADSSALEHVDSRCWGSKGREVSRRTDLVLAHGDPRDETSGKKDQDPVLEIGAPVSIVIEEGIPENVDSLFPAEDCVAGEQFLDVSSSSPGFSCCSSATLVDTVATPSPTLTLVDVDQRDAGDVSLEDTKEDSVCRALRSERKDSRDLSEGSRSSVDRGTDRGLMASASASSTGSALSWGSGQGPVARRDQLPLEEDGPSQWKVLLFGKCRDSGSDRTGYESDDDLESVDVEMKKLEDRIRKFEEDLAKDRGHPVNSVDDRKEHRSPLAHLKDQDIDRLKVDLPVSYPPVDMSRTKHMSLLEKKDIEMYEETDSDSRKSCEDDSSNSSAGCIFVKRKIKLKPGDRHCLSLNFHGRTDKSALISGVAQQLDRDMEVADGSDIAELLDKEISLLDSSTGEGGDDGDPVITAVTHVPEVEANSSSSREPESEKVASPAECLDEDFFELHLNGCLWQEVDGMTAIDFDELEHYNDSVSCDNIFFIFEDDDGIGGGHEEQGFSENLNRNGWVAEEVLLPPFTDPKVGELPSSSHHHDKKKNDRGFVSAFKNSFRKASKYLGPKPFTKTIFASSVKKVLSGDQVQTWDDEYGAATDHLLPEAPDDAELEPVLYPPHESKVYAGSYNLKARECKIVSDCDSEQSYSVLYRNLPRFCSTPAEGYSIPDTHVEAMPSVSQKVAPPPPSRSYKLTLPYVSAVNSAQKYAPFTCPQIELSGRYQFHSEALQESEESECPAPPPVPPLPQILLREHLDRDAEVLCDAPVCSCSASICLHRPGNSADSGICLHRQPSRKEEICFKEHLDVGGASDCSVCMESPSTRGQSPVWSSSKQCSSLPRVIGERKSWPPRN